MKLNSKKFNKVSNKLKDTILKTGQYIQFEVIVPNDEEITPYVKVDCEYGNTIMLAKTVAYAENLINAIEKKEPLVHLLKNNYGKNRDEVFQHRGEIKSVERIREDEE